MPVRLYSSNDVGAPQLSTVNDGSLINILRGCLVDGYGTRTPAGWTMPFHDNINQIAVFKPTMDIFWRVRDNHDDHHASQLMYRSMSDVNTGLGVCPTQGDLGTNTKLILGKRILTTTKSDEWYVVADDTFVMYFNNPDGQVYTPSFYFGGIDPVDPNAQDLVFIGGGVTNNTAAPTALFDDQGLHKQNGAGYISHSSLNNDKHVRVLTSKFSLPIADPSPITGRLQMVDWFMYEESPYNILIGSPKNIKCSVSNFKGFKFGDKKVLDGINYIIFQESINGCQYISYDTDVG